MPFGIRPKGVFDELAESAKWHPPMLAPVGSDFSSMLTRTFNPERAEAEMLARTAVGEARGEGDEGMRAVMHTIVNRMEQAPGSSITDVVLAPNQFSAWNAGNPNREFMEQLQLDENEPLIDIAEKVIARQEPDPTGGATHYFAPKHTKRSPAWAEKMEQTAVIGGHEFYREPKRRGRGG